MKQEDKELLLKDLCARLPYGVKVQHQHQNYLNEVQTIEHISRQYGEIETESVLGFVDDFKPYLRPMSSMTKEDKEELAAVLGVDYIDNKVVDFGEFLCEGSPVNIEDVYGLLDWLNAHHFDYRGLIGRNLAISTEVFNPYKD